MGGSTQEHTIMIAVTNKQNNNYTPLLTPLFFYSNRNSYWFLREGKKSYWLMKEKKSTIEGGKNSNIKIINQEKMTDKLT